VASLTRQPLYPGATPFSTYLIGGLVDSDPMWSFWRLKSLTAPGILTPDLPACSSVAITLSCTWKLLYYDGSFVRVIQNFSSTILYIHILCICVGYPTHWMQTCLVFYKQMHIFSFRAEKIVPACTEKYIIEVSEIITIVFLCDTHGTLANATAVFRNLHLSICIR